MLIGVVCMLKRIGPRTEPWGTPQEGDRVVMRNYRQEQRKSEILSKFRTMQGQSLQYRTRMRDDGVELSDLWCQRQQKGREGRGRRLVDGLLL